MHSEISIVGPDHATAGPVSLAQGVYGARGNLELVACDAADGLWVYWFNADHEDDPPATPDVPPGQWSAGLAFAEGRRYIDAQIVQSSLGPDHLEVLALTAEGVLESWYWSAGPGFQRRDAEAAASVRRFRLTHRDGVLHAHVEHTDGTGAVVESRGEDYPGRAWHEVDRIPVVGDPGAQELLRAHGVSDLVEGTARSAHSTRDGGTTELTWRDLGGSIRHLGIRD
ncbi:hypothetical protein AB3M89_10430 [Microbacterium sp. 179-I 3D2 NHS]|uniref:hypothetical protein n=1 Tax=Microbacterium sp. 179-I 3D2 NHS TaxID=3235178 RepID=UPI0039A0E3A9